MGPVYLFALASQQADWLTLRQAVIADNVANANTPGYRAGDVAPFQSVYDGTWLDLVTSDRRHLGREPSTPDSIKVKDAATWDIHHSGNSVGLEQELMKANEVQRAYSLNSGILKAFNRMWLASLKG